MSDRTLNILFSTAFVLAFYLAAIYRLDH